MKNRVHHPKPNKTELRLYLSSRAGFMPKRGDVWFLYESRTDGALWIGAMPESRWRGINTESLIDKREEVGSKKMLAIRLLSKNEWS